LRQHEQTLRQREIEVCVVTFDAGPMAEAYVRETALPWPLLRDETRQLYRSYQMDRADWWAIYGPASIWHYLRLLFQGRRLQRPGSDWRQLGGDVLIDPTGVIRLHFVSSSPHDRPTIESILAVMEANHDARQPGS
jgi:peroxiredoxin